jgi:streptogramin lyase
MGKKLLALLLATAVALGATASASSDELYVAVLKDTIPEGWFVEDYTNGWVLPLSTDSGNPPPDNPARVTEYSVPPNAPTPHGVAKEPGLVGSEQGSEPHIWFTSLSSNNVVRLDPQTALETVYTIPGAGGITDIRVTPDKEVWFDTGGDIGFLDPATNTGVIYQTNMGFLDWVHVDQFGNVWVAELGGNRIAVLNPDTGVVTQYAIGASNTGLARRRSGDVWWCERGTGMIGRLDPKTNLVRHYTTSFDRLEGCTIDPLGNPDGLVWVTPGFASAQPVDGVGALDPSALTFTRYDTPTQPSNPYGITIGCAGSVAFGEDAASQIGLLVPSLAVGTTTPSVATTSVAVPVPITPVQTPFVATTTTFQAAKFQADVAAATVNGFREYDTVSQGGEGPHLVVIGPNEKIVYSHLFSSQAQNGRLGIVELPPSARCNKQ